MLAAELASVEHGEGEAVGVDGAEFFHEVQGERGLAGAESVEEADVGVEADGFGAAVDAGAQEPVQEREHGVDGVGGRSFRPESERRDAAGGFQEQSEAPVVQAGRVAFGAEKLFDGGDAGQCFEGPGEFVGDVAEFGLAAAEGVAGGDEEHLAAVLDLSGDAAAGDLQPFSLVGVGQVLGVTEEDVAVDLPVHTGQEAAGAGHHDDGAAVFGAAGQQVRADADVPVGDDRVESAEREPLVPGAVGRGQLDRVVVEVERGALRLDVERVQQFGHSQSPWISLAGVKSPAAARAKARWPDSTFGMQA